MPIMDRFKHGVDLTKFKADQLMRVNHSQTEITALNQRITSIQRQLVVVVGDLYKRGVLANKELEDLCLEIDSVSQAIAAKENEIAAIRAETPPQYLQNVGAVIEPVPANPCPNCRFDMPAGSDFCPNCGRPIDKLPSPSGLVCPNCSYPLTQGAKFCPNCGFKLVQNEDPSPQEEQS